MYYSSMIPKTNCKRKSSRLASGTQRVNRRARTMVQRGELEHRSELVRSANEASRHYLQNEGETCAGIRGECKLPTTIKDGMMCAPVGRNARRAPRARAAALRFTIQELDTIGTTGSRLITEQRPYLADD